MADSEGLSSDSEFFWDNVVFQVEDKLFCVPRCEFVRSSEIFADMFMLPSGAGARSEGRDREHPIVLEGYKKTDFACLLRVMYPTAESLISGTQLALNLKKEEWVSVLKLSVLWNMSRIRDYAIHKLSTDPTLLISPVEKILLARAHKVGAWLDEGLAALVRSDYRPTFEELATLGWETAARILWIRDSSINGSNPLRFRRDDIKCTGCSSSLSLIKDSHICDNCENVILADEELIFTSPDSNSASGLTDRHVSLRAIQSSRCGGNPFYSSGFYCQSCSQYVVANRLVRIAGRERMIKEMFGEEIKEYELAMTVA